MSNAKVFISYSHDSPEHSERVLDLAFSVRGNGIDVELDQFHNEEIVDWVNAAIAANNLSELELMLGEVARAVLDAEQSVNYADRSGDAV